MHVLSASVHGKFQRRAWHPGCMPQKWQHVVGPFTFPVPADSALLPLAPLWACLCFLVGLNLGKVRFQIPAFIAFYLSDLSQVT